MDTGVARLTLVLGAGLDRNPEFGLRCGDPRLTCGTVPMRDPGASSARIVLADTGPTWPRGRR